MILSHYMHLFLRRLFYAAPSTKFILNISLNESHYIHLILCISFLLLLAIGSTFLLLDLIPGSPFPNPHCLTADSLNLPPPPHWLNGSCHNHPHLCFYIIIIIADYDTCGKKQRITEIILDSNLVISFKICYAHLALAFCVY